MKNVSADLDILVILIQDAENLHAVHVNQIHVDQVLNVLFCLMVEAVADVLMVWVEILLVHLDVNVMNVKLMMIAQMHWLVLDIAVVIHVLDRAELAPIVKSISIIQFVSAMMDSQEIP